MERESEPFGPGEYRRRRRLYRDLASREKLDGVLVSRAADVRYLCGFSGSSGMVLILPRSGWFLTDFRYREQSREEVTGLRTVICEEGFGRTLRDLLSRAEKTRLGPGEGTGGAGGESTAKAGTGTATRIGFDPQTLSYSELLEMRRNLKGAVSLVPLKKDLQSLRAVKSPSEVEVLKAGLRTAEKAFREALRRVDGKTTERELAIEIDLAARRRGAEALAFETIVAGGNRGAVVHAKPTDRKLGGATVVDWGIVRDGYCTDCTRTLAFGRIPSELKKVHLLILEAQECALEKIRPGARARDVDRAAREILERAGYGKAFGHGLGHGVGLEVHERPHLGPKSRDVLQQGMVFTVEPGVYLPGVGGVRVEDMVLVTADGVEVLTSLPRSLDPSDY